MTQIDILEREYLTEYDLIIQKDKEEGKDFNMLAYNDLKRAQYYFKYLRDSEKLYKQEPNWREKESKKETSKAPKQVTERAISLDVDEEDLFKSKAQSRANSVLEASKPEQFARGRLTQQFREEFKDIYEESLDVSRRV
jgi:hypothetical protein